MAFCIHRYSVIKRWLEKGKLYVIQRCRKCELWKRREIDALNASDPQPSMITQEIKELKLAPKQYPNVKN